MIIYQIHDQHGWHISYSPTEAQYNNTKGWRTVDEHDFYVTSRKKKVEQEPESTESPDQERDEAIEQYKKAFGTAPHGRMTTANILKAVHDNG